MNKKIDISNFSWPKVTADTQQEISEFLNGNQRSADGIITGFEKELEVFFQVRHALLTCNGTSAALSCFHALKLGPGDEIIGPAFTHWATVFPASLLGCSIVFADTEAHSMSISADDIQRKITSRTKAVVVCHLYGNPVDIPAIRKLCDDHNLSLIEDISHAPGATINAKPVGSFGDLSFCSMQKSKIISAGEGGFILTNNSELYECAMLLGHPKRIHELSAKWQHYHEVSLGYKFRIAPLMAIVGRASFHDLENQNTIREKMYSALMEEAGDLTSIQAVSIQRGASRVFWEYDLLLSESVDPEEISVQLCKSGIISGPAKFVLLPALQQFKSSIKKDGEFPNALKNMKRLLLLAPFTRYNPKIIADYASIMKQILIP